MLRKLLGAGAALSVLAGLPALAQTSAENECEQLAGFFEPDGDIRYSPEIDGEAAERACRAASTDNPASVKMKLFLIRALDKQKDEDGIKTVLAELPDTDPTGMMDYVKGVLHVRGMALPESQLDFAEKMQASSDKGFAPAYLEMADIAGWRGEEEWGEFGSPLDWNLKAANAGLAGGYFFAGYDYENGISAPRDIEQANKHYELAAQMGHLNGKAFLGTNLIWGIGLDADPERAARLFTESSAGGNAYGTCRLGNLYELGIGVEKDQKKSAELYKQGFEQSEEEGICVIGLTEAYFWGRGKREDNAMARYWAEKAADLEEAEGYMYLGQIYLYGYGVKTDERRAFAYFENGTELGSDIAAAELGEMYELGKATDKDIDRAIEYYVIAADGGNSWAQWRLGTMYRDGKDVPQNLNRSLEFFFASAESDFDDARQALIAFKADHGSDPSLDPELSARLNAPNPDWMQAAE